MELMVLTPRLYSLGASVKLMWSIILLIGLSLPVAGADLENNSAKRLGLTNKEAQEFFYSNQEIHKWHKEKTLAILFVATIAGGAVLGMPGGFLTGIHCYNYANYLNQRDCLGNYTQDYCQNVYPRTLTIDDPVCHVGISLLSIIGLPLLGTICSGPITKLQNHIAQKINNYRQQNFVHHVIKGSCLFDKVSIQGIHFLAPYIKDSDDMLKELSVEQALALADIMPLEEFHELAKDAFAKYVSIYANKFYLLLSMEKADFKTVIVGKKLLKLFKKEPAFFETIVRLLPEANMLDSDVISSLKEVLQKLLDQPEDDEDLAKILFAISKGERIAEYKKLINVAVDVDNLVTLKFGHQEINIDKTLLINTSTYFDSFFKRWSSNIVDLTSENERWVRVVVDEALGKVVDMSDKNLVDVLSAACFFGVKSIFERCDTYICEQDLLPKVIKLAQKFTDEVETIDINSPIGHYQFCCDYCLLTNRKAMAKKIIFELNNMNKININLINDIRKLTKQDLDEVYSNIDLTSFIKRLEKPEYLRAVWDNAKDISIIFDILNQFCRQKDNHHICESAWVEIPDHLEDAMKNAH